MTSTRSPSASRPSISQISQVQGAGQQPNDLRDQRDQLLNQLSRLVPVSQAGNANGSVNIYVGSSALVLGNDALTMTAGTNAAGDSTVVWTASGAAVALTGGEIQGLTTARDGPLASQQSAYDQLISTVITQVNPVLEADPSLVAAATAPTLPSDNRGALAIAKLRDSLTMSGGTATLNMFYESITATLGTASRQAGATADNQRALVDLLTRRQQSVSGVNLDEEATNLIKYQHVYQAAARVVTAVDEMLDKIINGMGRVGL